MAKLAHPTQETNRPWTPYWTAFRVERHEIVAEIVPSSDGIESHPIIAAFREIGAYLAEHEFGAHNNASMTVSFPIWGMIFSVEIVAEAAPVA